MDTHDKYAVCLASRGTSRMRFLSLIGILAAAFSACVAVGGEKVARDTMPALQQSYTWYNGEVKRTVWLNPRLVAEFNPGPETESPLRQSYGTVAKALPASSRAYVRFWELPSGNAEAAVRSLTKSHPASRLSPVFHDVSSPGGSKRALPGDVIVAFNPSWELPQVNEWISARGLEIVKKLSAGPQVYVLKTAPGIEALETANAIYESGDVMFAMPNWWEELVTR